MRQRLTEAQVSRQCLDLLRCRGWRPIRLQSGLVTRNDGGRYRVGEKGMPDYLCLRVMAPGESETFYLELKATGKAPSVQQEIYHEQLRNCGFLVCVADSVDALDAWMTTNFEGKR